MRNSIFVLLISFVFLYSCNRNSNNSGNSKPKKNQEVQVKTADDARKELLSKDDLPKFEIVKENTVDKPVKTQVVQYILAKDKIEPVNLRALLSNQYEEIRNRDGFKYHDKPTNVFLYVYDSMDGAKSEGLNWVASLQKGYEESSPTIQVNEDQIRLDKQPEKKEFDLSTTKRKKIYKEIIRTSNRAIDGAMEQEPNDWEAQITIEDRLRKKYKQQVANKYNLTTAELDSIALEGATKKWAFPK